MCFSESAHHDRWSESSGTRSSSLKTIDGPAWGDLESSLNDDVILLSKTFVGDDGMEDDIPPAETILTETSVRSLSWGFNFDRIPMLGVEDIDEPAGGLKSGDEDSWGEDIRFKTAAVAQKRWEWKKNEDFKYVNLYLLRGNSLQSGRFSSGSGVLTP